MKRCIKCWGANRDGARFCGHCGRQFMIYRLGVEWITAGIARGVVCAMSGFFIYRWASAHSPHIDLGEAFMRGMVEGKDAYLIKEPFYSMALVVAAGLSLLGIVLLTIEAAVIVKKRS